MFLFGAILVGVAQILDAVLKFIIIVMVVSAILSWIRLDSMNSAVRFVSAIADPLINLVRRSIRTQFGAIDLAPVIVVLAAMFLQTVLVSSLFKYGCDFAGPSMRGCGLTLF